MAHRPTYFSGQDLYQITDLNKIIGELLTRINDTFLTFELKRT